MAEEQIIKDIASAWTYNAFMEKTNVSVEDLCREIFHGNHGTIKIKKEKTAVKNLVALYQTTLMLSAQKGFRAMTLRDLCRESGLSMGALYSYITCKDDLLNILQNFGFRYISRILTSSIDEFDTPWEKLQSFIRTHIYLSEALPELFNFFFMESKNLGRDVQKVMIAAELFTEQMIAQVLEEGKQKEEFHVSNPLMTSALLKPMLQDWYLKKWKYSGRGIRVEDYADSVIDLMEVYLRR